MSHEATNWAIKQKGLKPAVKLVLWHLADHHNPSFGGAFPAQKTLAAECEISRASLNRYLDELEQRGLIRREQRVNSATGLQERTQYRLAFEEGFVPQDVVVRVSNCDTDRRVSESAVSVSQSCETLTSKGTSNTPLPPYEPDGLQALLDLWPEEAARNQDNIRAAFARMAARDREQAVSTAALFVRTLAKRHERLPALTTYLQNRLWADFVDAPEIDFDGYFRITPARPEWGPWVAFLRTRYGEKAANDVLARGVFLSKSRKPEVTR